MGKKKKVLKENSSSSYLSSVKANYQINNQLTNLNSKLNNSQDYNILRRSKYQQFYLSKDYIINQGYNNQNKLSILNFRVKNHNFQVLTLQKLQNNFVKIFLSDLNSENYFFWGLKFIFENNMQSKSKYSFALNPILINDYDHCSIFEIITLSTNPDICYLKYKDINIQNKVFDQDLYLTINNYQVELLNYDTLMFGYFLRNDDEITKFKILSF